MPSTTCTSTGSPSSIAMLVPQMSSSSLYDMEATKLKCLTLVQPTWSSRARPLVLGPSCTVPLRCSPMKTSLLPPNLRPPRWTFFSYGILLLEVIGKEIPNPATRYIMLQQIKDRCQRELIVQCTKPLPSDRPAMTDILDSLHKIH